MRATVAVLALSSLLIAGCSSGPSVAGNWNVTNVKGMPDGSTMKASFTNPDKMQMTFVMKAPMGATEASIAGTVDGTFKMEGETMTMSATAVDMKVSGVPDNLKSIVEGQMESGEKQVKDQFNQGGKQKMKWDGQDKFTLTDSQNNSATFERAK